MKLKVSFTDFWPGFNKEDNPFINMLKNHFLVELSDDPDLLVFSCFGFAHYHYNCHKIFYTGENVRPDFKLCDLALSFDWDESGGMNIRLPLFRFNGGLENLLQVATPHKSNALREKFCCMLVSNPAGKERNEFFKLLSTYKTVDSGGAFNNNIGRRIVDKQAFFRNYKFVLCFENSFHPGYTTEKLPDAISAGCLPIYWGNPAVGKDFNEDRIVNVGAFPSFEASIDFIKKLDRDDAVFRSVLQKPIFPTNAFPEHLQWSVIEHKFVASVRKLLDKKPVTQTFRYYPLYSKIRKKVLSKVTKRPHWHC